MIEFTHRVTSGISFFSAIGLLAWTWVGTARGHLARTTAWATVIFTLVEAVLGALLVKLGLTAQSQSPLRAPYLALHLANTLLLLAALTLTAHFLGRSQGYLRHQVRLAVPAGGLIALFSLLVVGVTGSLAALGDTLFPARSLTSALAADFARQGSWLLRWRWTHPGIALLASVFLIWLLVKAWQGNANGDHRALTGVALALLAAQYLLGVLDVLLLAPVWLQLVHLFGADALWAALVVLAARVTLLPRESGDRERRGALSPSLG